MLAYKNWRHSAKIKQQQRELYYFRESLAKGDMVRLSTGEQAEVIDLGKDFVFIARHDGVAIINKRDVLPLNQN